MRELSYGKLSEKVRLYFKNKLKGSKYDAYDAAAQYIKFLKCMDEKEVKQYLEGFLDTAHIGGGVKDFKCFNYNKLAIEVAKLYTAQKNQKRSFIKGGKLVIQERDNIKDEFEEITAELADFDGFSEDEDELPSIDDLY